MSMHGFTVYGAMKVDSPENAMKAIVSKNSLVHISRYFGSDHCNSF